MTRAATVETHGHGGEHSGLRGTPAFFPNEQARVRLSPRGEGFVIDRIALTLNAAVPGLDEARFQEIAASAKNGCPLSKALASVAEISLQATLDHGAA